MVDDLWVSIDATFHLPPQETNTKNTSETTPHVIFHGPEFT